ncbi:MAG TPA: IS110 family transposase [Chitinophagaceae bacterium]|nr:IS110 family transposase [Chitinophagaceae bacterium]
MNKFKSFVGIDVSKKTFDVAVLDACAPLSIAHHEFAQTQAGYASFLSWLQHQRCCSEVLICMEHTGIYINGLVNFLAAQGFAIWVEMPLRIKKSMGLQRGGDDKLAAINIVQYAWRYNDQARLWRPSDQSLNRLRQYIVQRDRLVLALNQLTVPLQELEEVGLAKEILDLRKIQDPVCRAITRSIAKIEAMIEELLSSDTEVKQIIERVSSIKGIGKQTAINLYIYTKGFTQFENAKQLACYCGVVPFAKSSGTSVRYKPAVSPYANRKLKKLLHLCAMAAIRWNDDMKIYYERKVNEGKNKMSVINAVRNKLIHRIFAVVRDKRNYVEKLHAARA